MTNPYKTTLTLVAANEAEPSARTILEGARQRLGFAPNMYGAMANAPGLLQTYTFGYDLFRREAGFTPVEQEVIFLAVSRENDCHYCVAAHSVIADMMSKVPTAVTDAIRDDAAIFDRKLDALRNFVKVMARKRGNPSAADARAFLDAGYTEKHILGIILAIGIKTLSNYTNHVFQTPVDPVFQARAWAGRPD